MLSLSSECHPDRTHQATAARKQAAQDRFTELNAAYQCLLDPRERLLALIELEFGKRASEVQSIPPDLMSLFLEVGNVCREADAFLTQKATQTSPLLKVQIFEQAQDRIEKLRAVQRQVAESRDALLSDVRRLDYGWDILNASEKESRAGRLQEMDGLMNYSKRWNAQIQERVVQLSF